jgi:hypothetical protein
MTASVPEPGRALIEGGAPVAGSMSRGAATVVYAPAAVQVDERLAACLRAAADDAAALTAPGERIRAGAVLAFAVEHAVTLAGKGRAVRTDAFFTPAPGTRAPMAELLEAVVAAARRSTDERRVRHLGYLVAEAACSPDLDLPVVGRALRLAEPLPWRSLCLLAAVGRRDRVPLPLAPLEDDPRGWSAWGAREDLTNLQRGGLLDPPPAAPRPGGAALPRLRVADLRLTRRGVLVHRLLALEFLREEAITAALADLGLRRS